MKIFYHNDNDGKCSAAMIYLYAKNNNIEINSDDLYPLNYFNKLINVDNIKKDEIVYILDYSFNNKTKDTIIKIYNKTKNLYFYDHHKSSLEIIDILKDVCKYCIVDINNSASKIVYNKYIKNTNMDSENLSKIIELINDYDLGINKIKDSLFFNLGSVIYNNEPISSIWNSNPEKIINSGKIIYKYNIKINNENINTHAYYVNINNKICIILNNTTKSHRIFNKLYDKYKFAIRWAFDGLIYEYSIYSEFNDIDCSKIAEYFDYSGGGHKRAAGFRSKTLLFKQGDKFTIN